MNKLILSLILFACLRPAEGIEIDYRGSIENRFEYQLKNLVTPVVASPIMNTSRKVIHPAERKSPVYWVQQNQECRVEDPHFYLVYPRDNLLTEYRNKFYKDGWDRFNPVDAKGKKELELKKLEERKKIIQSIQKTFPDEVVIHLMDNSGIVKFKFSEIQDFIVEVEQGVMLRLPDRVEGLIKKSLKGYVGVVFVENAKNLKVKLTLSSQIDKKLPEISQRLSTYFKNGECFTREEFITEAAKKLKARDEDSFLSKPICIKAHEEAYNTERWRYLSFSYLKTLHTSTEKKYFEELIDITEITFGDKKIDALKIELKTDDYIEEYSRKSGMMFLFEIEGDQGSGVIIEPNKNAMCPRVYFEKNMEWSYDDPICMTYTC